MAGSILIVEDDQPISDMLLLVLKRHGYKAVAVGDYDSAMQTLKPPYPDLIILDWMIPGGSGIQLARQLKRDQLLQHIPIIMLTARGEESDTIRGLEAGADDYVTKPFSPKELVARIRAVIRRSSPANLGDMIDVGGLRLDPVAHRTSANDQLIQLGPTEFRLLHFFMTHPERVYSRGQLLDHVWGPHIYVADRTVDVHILRLRKALEPHGFDHLIQTVRGAGYRLSTQT